MAALNMKLMTAGADKIYRESEFPIASLNIKRDESAADMLEVKLVGEVKEFPSFLRVYLEGNMIFDGITDDLIFRDTFDPVLENLIVTFNGASWNEGTNYTYDELTGEFVSLAGQITVPAATFTQNPDGTYTVTPGISTITITGTV